MNEYKVVPLNRRNSVLTKNGTEIGELNYTNWSNSKADLIINNGPAYTLAPKGFWERTIEISENGIPVLSFKMSWKGGLWITTMGDQFPVKYRLKRKSLWRSSYELIDEAGEQLLLIDTEFKWKGFRTEYTFTPSLIFERSPKKELLMLTSICVINYQNRMAAAASAAT